MRITCCAMLLLLVTATTPADRLTAGQVRELRARIRANFFVPDALPALEAQTHRRLDPAPGVTAEAVTYATEFGTRVPAVLYLPTPLPKRRIPGFIVVNGHGGDKHSWYSYCTGIAFARAGAAVLTYDQAGEAEGSAQHRSGTRDHDRLQGGPIMARRLSRSSARSCSTRGSKRHGLRAVTLRHLPAPIPSEESTMTMSGTVSRRDLIKQSMAVAAALPLAPQFLAARSAAPVEVDPFGGLKIGVATYTFRKFPLEATIKGIQRVGLHYASIKDFHMPRNTTAEQRKAIAQQFRDAGITPLSCGNITMDNTEKSVREAFEYARDAGIPTIVCSPHPDSFAILDKMVKEFEIKLAIHNHGPEDGRFPSPYDVYRAVQPYDRRIGLCVDVGHSARAGAEPAAAILKCRDRVYDVHLKDIADTGRISHPVESGRGVLNLKAIMSALREIKFAYMADFEYEKDAADPLPGLAESVGFTRGLLAGAV